MAGPLIGSSAAFKKVTETIAMVSSVDTAVLILGETGTGKELIARAIHDSGPRCQQRFVAVNCAAIPFSLIESELFGHERGAFTGAVSQCVGVFRPQTTGRCSWMKLVTCRSNCSRSCFACSRSGRLNAWAAAGARHPWTCE